MIQNLIILHDQHILFLPYTTYNGAFVYDSYMFHFVITIIVIVYLCVLNYFNSERVMYLYHNMSDTCEHLSHLHLFHIYDLLCVSVIL